MAVALVSHTSVASSGGANVTTAGINTAGATLLVAVIGFLSAGGRTMSLTDSNSNTWSQLTQNDGTLANQTYYAVNPTVGAGHTFTGTNGGTTAYGSLCVAAFSGVVTTTPFDQSNGAQNASSTTQQPGSITPSANNELVVTTLENNTPLNTLTINGSYSITDQVTAVGGNTVGSGLAYWVQTTATATNPTWTQSVASAANLVIMSFKATAAATNSNFFTFM